MKNSYLLFTFLLFMLGVSAKATNPNEKTNPGTETSTEVKSNVVIFKLIPTSTTNDNSTNNTTNNSGSLKKAGKVARTSYCHSTSLENIIYKKKGI
jgi:hypothetical protein